MRQFSLVPMLQRDHQGTDLNVTPPKHWPAERQAAFRDAIDGLEWR
jgi:hypothetical protein